MRLQLDIPVEKCKYPIKYDDSLLLIGSCFTANIGKMLADRKFDVKYNPTGILFDPLSISHHVHDYINYKNYTVDALFQLNDLYHSWHHHTAFSDVKENVATQKINDGIAIGANYIKKASWIIITMGSAFGYHHLELKIDVANCHRAPAQWFEKRMVRSPHIVECFAPMLDKLASINPELKILFTISPVRHIRDGVVENNWSKAQLIDAVHTLRHQFPNLVHYFPAYELAIDVLRDYRFYDIDLVHPNYLATEIIFEHFAKTFFTETTQDLSESIYKITLATQHMSMNVASNAHQQFVKRNLEKINEILQQHPHIDFKTEQQHFRSHLLDTNFNE